MNFTPEKNVVRTLIIRSGDYSSDPVEFSVPLSFNEPEYDHCYIKLKQFLLDESTSITQDNVLKSISFELVLFWGHFRMKHSLK